MSEENKNNLMILSIVAIVAIVGLSFIFLGRGNANYAGKAAGTLIVDENGNLVGQAMEAANKRPPQIKATSCDADGVCEINAGTMSAIKVGSGFNGNPSLYVNQIGQSYEVQLNSKTTFNDNVVVNSGLTSNAIKVGSAMNGLPALYVNVLSSPNTGSEVQINSKSTFKDNVVIESGLTTKTMKISELTGTGNAYACLDGEGKLFRSTKPCT